MSDSKTRVRADKTSAGAVPLTINGRGLRKSAKANTKAGPALVHEFPFPIKASLLPIIEHLRTVCDEAPRESILRDSLLGMVERLGAISELSELTGNPLDASSNKALFADLLSVLGGEIGRIQYPSALIMPFVKSVIYAEPQFLAFTSAMWNADSMKKSNMLPLELLGIDSFDTIMALHAYTLVLSRIYGLAVSVPPMPAFESTDPVTGQQVFYRTTIDFRFLRIVPSSPKGYPELSAADKSRLIEHLEDFDLINSILPAKDFTFEGLALCRVEDITQSHLVTLIQGSLTEVDAVMETEKLVGIEKLIQGLLDKPDTTMTLVAFQPDHVLELQTKPEICEYRGLRRNKRSDYEDSIFFDAFAARSARVIDDIHNVKSPGAIEQELMSYGVRSVLIVPLVIDSQSVGLAVLSSETAGYLNQLDALRLSEIVPSMAVALSRGITSFESQIRSNIQEQYTSIHPSVEWKFRRIAIDQLMSSRGPSRLEAEDVAFENVYPLYAVSDIRSSSQFRNDAIRADLQTQLGLAKDVFVAASEARALPILDEMRFRIEEYLKGIRNGISSGEEITLLSFLSQEVEPAMKGLEEFDERTAAAQRKYLDALHPEHHSVYEKRRDFDQSVTRINKEISSFVDSVEPEAQKMFPHYFDKNSTDGVDMNIYVGPSLVPDHAWNPIYLKNLRLWQFLVMAKVARRAFEIKSELALPLQTTHLIVVQDMPISIRFNNDEKRFAVDGAYNIRYEIMKKRIDKALIKGSGERLTQPDRIAIVYSQPAERLEYERYIRYLQSDGFLDSEFEDLEIDDLQGITGLKALRVKVKVDSGLGLELVGNALK